MNQQIIQIVKRLTEEQPDQLCDDAEQFKQWLNQTPEDDPEAVRQTANRLIQRLREAHPDTWETVRQEIDVEDNESIESIRLGLHMLPGESGGIPPGTRMACPKPDCGYRRSLRQTGQTLFCPIHATVLVPETRLS